MFQVKIDKYTIIKSLKSYNCLSKKPLTYLKFFKNV